ncbi:MAG TPA: aryl-sulfate sulfotransferase [Chthoniobacterales bacterium]
MRVLFISVALLCFCRSVLATQADDTVITVDGSTAGATPFLSQVTLSVSDTTALKSVQFAIAPKPGSSTRPLAAIYSSDYLLERGNIVNGKVFLPVYGLYDNYANTVTLTYSFNDGSSKTDTVTIATAVFTDPCAYKNPTVIQARTAANSLSYDFMLLKGSCSTYSPAILDTDGALRWVGTAGAKSFTLAFFQNSIYVTDGTSIYRNDLDGTVELLGNFAGSGVKDFHHNVDRGKVGLLFEVDTKQYFESTIMEIDTAGNLLKIWNMADIITAAMTAGGDDPAQFVFKSPNDWFHSNSVTYDRADDSLIISSREDFVICIDYTTGAIKWILGDPTKAWYQFPSLRQYALTLAPGSLPPIGQHAVSITHDQSILVLDNGLNSLFQQPAGTLRTYTAPRKYRLDLTTRTATEVWNYPMDEALNSPYCGSVYEDLPLNYLVDYAYVFTEQGQALHVRLVGLESTGEKVFDYQYLTAGCTEVFNATPLHLESTAFPSVGPQSLNLSTRGLVGPAEEALIAGFIVTGNESKTVVLRALGPSLADAGLSGTLADPAITLYDSSGAVVATNDNWSAADNASQIAAQGLAPGDPAEAALLTTLAPGAYTVVVSAADSATGLALAEIYDVSPASDSSLANMSTRGMVGGGTDDLLISGFIVGAVDNSAIVLRSLGPSLGAAGITETLSDPSFNVYDQNGSLLGGNDDWRNDPSAPDLELNQLAPPNDSEAATVLFLPPGAYTAVTAGADGGTGIGLIEVYNLE